MSSEPRVSSGSQRIRTILHALSAGFGRNTLPASSQSSTKFLSYSIHHILDSAPPAHNEFPFFQLFTTLRQQFYGSGRPLARFTYPRRYTSASHLVQNSLSYGNYGVLTLEQQSAPAFEGHFRIFVAPFFDLLQFPIHGFFFGALTGLCLLFPFLLSTHGFHAAARWAATKICTTLALYLVSCLASWTLVLSLRHHTIHTKFIPIM